MSQRFYHTGCVFVYGQVSTPGFLYTLALLDPDILSPILIVLGRVRAMLEIVLLLFKQSLRRE